MSQAIRNMIKPGLFPPIDQGIDQSRSQALPITTQIIPQTPVDPLIQRQPTSQAPGFPVHPLVALALMNRQQNITPEQRQSQFAGLFSTQSPIFNLILQRLFGGQL